MKITILVDNNTLIDTYYLGEPAFAAWIEDGDRRVLFDCGYSEVLLRNADAMGIDPTQADFIAFSHGHADHSWGVIPLLQRINLRTSPRQPAPRPCFVGHPAAFWSRHSGRVSVGQARRPGASAERLQTGPLLSAGELARFGEVRQTEEPLWLSDRLVFLGHIPSVFPFEERKPSGTLETPDGPQPDLLPDDSALACLTREGIVLVTGCAHAGICSTIERAKAVCRESRVRDVIGGFHLYRASADRRRKVVEYLQQLRPQILHPLHCTGRAVLAELSALLPPEELGVGLELRYED